MLTWDDIEKWGRRASDIGATAPAAPRRDLLLEAAIAHEQVDVLYQPLIDPQSGRILGAEALARSPIVAGAEMLFARAPVAFAMLAIAPAVSLVGALVAFAVDPVTVA